MISCKGCGKPIVVGELRRGDNHHAECHPLYNDELSRSPRRRKSTPRHEQDIKAPDGYTLGGMRRVRSDGTVLFGRQYWPVPNEWIGHRIWVHVADGYGCELEVAPPGQHIYKARIDGSVQFIRDTVRDARHCYRRPENRAWAERRQPHD